MSAPSHPPPHSVMADDEIDLGQLVRTIWRGKLWIVLSAFLALVIGGYYAFAVATPLYTTSAYVMREADEQPLVDFSGSMSALSGGGDQSAINTEIEVLRSRSLLEKLVAELDLTKDPEFNTDLTPASSISIGAAINLVRSVFGASEDPTLALGSQQILDKVVDNLRAALSVSNIRQSYVYNLTVVTESAEKSALIVNTLADVYIANQLDVKNEANVAATSWLTDRVSQLRIDLENAESVLKDFDAGSDLINADTLAALNRQVKGLRDRLEALRSSQTEIAVQLSLLRNTQLSGDPQLMAETAQDRALDNLLAGLPANPELNQTLFDARYAQVILEKEQAIRRLDEQIIGLEQSIVQQEQTTEQQSNDLVQLQQLQREAEASGLLYEYFLSRMKEISVQSGIQTPESRVLSRAVVPLNPSAPRKSIILALALILGAFVGAAFVLIREMTQNTFRAAEDLEHITGKTVLGQIPLIPVNRRDKVLQYLREKPTSVAAEAIRNMRTSILLSDVDNPPQVIMSTSSVPGEGKTTQSLALAQNLSSLGKKVLLVEGDLRKRVFSEYFEIKQDVGLLAVLEDKVKLKDAIVYQDSLKADVLMSERPSKNAADIFSSQAFSKFMADVRKDYDYIVIDTPPVLAVPDARIVGRLVDATIFTVRWDHTPQRQVVEALRSLRDVNVKVAGLVLGQIDLKGQEKYGYGSSYGYYDSYHEN